MQDTLTNKMSIAHIADCHLRAAQYGSRDRGEAFSAGLMNACKKAAELNTRHILCAGDLLDTTNPSSSVIVNGLKPVHDYLREQKMTMYVIKGNHDNVTPHWCELFADGKDYGIKMPAERELFYIEGVSVLPIHYCTNDRFPMDLISELNPDIVMWHGEIKEFLGYPKEDAISIDDFPKDWKGLCVLGDQHITKKITRSYPFAPATFMYSGSTELCARSEDPQKYVVEYKFEREEGKEYELSQIVLHPFETQKVIIAEIKTAEELEAFVADHADIDNSVIFAIYDAEIPSAASKLQTVKGNKTTLNLVPCLDTSVMDTVMEMDRTTLKNGPSTFFLEHKDAFLTQKELEELTPLVADILNPDLNMQTVVSKFVEQQTGKLIV